MNKFYSYIIGTVIFTIMGFIINALFSTEDDNDTEVPEEENPLINDNSEDSNS